MVLFAVLLESLPQRFEFLHECAPVLDWGQPEHRRHQSVQRRGEPCRHKEAYELAVGALGDIDAGDAALRRHGRAAAPPCPVRGAYCLPK